MEGQVKKDDHVRLRSELLQLSEPYPTHGRLTYPCCSQFWVTRERIRRHPPSYYARLFAALTNASDPFYQVLGKTPAAGSSNEIYTNRTTFGNFLLEAYWHVIFGEAQQYHLPYKSYDHLPGVPATVVDQQRMLDSSGIEMEIRVGQRPSGPQSA